ncbi:hypothetical protein FJR39_09710 [Dolichospermum flos-aquae UHCC 0037]|uniref:Uncharacterized protein n=1 Tax=Dolichospermum flos-aquae UHCC 0037 TaxID=2590026 RepID=A0ACC7S6M8_DOLFA|nr:hypothetical protein [Dolichospermum flos-aquae UHCC 0037]
MGCDRLKLGVVCDRCLGMLGCDSEALRRNRLKLGGCVRSLFRNKLGERSFKIGVVRSLFGDVGSAIV